MQRSDQLWSRLPFEDDGENDLSGLDLVDDIGVLQAGVPAVNILDALADLQFRGKDKDGKIDLEAQTGLDAKVGGAELYEIFRLAG